MTITIEELIARWNTDEGRPFMGQLIDQTRYKADPNDIGCMCAQGQVLHLVGGISAEELTGRSQMQADREVASLLGISRAHSIFLRRINDSVEGSPAIVLIDLSKLLGDKVKAVVAAWWCIEEKYDAACADAAACAATADTAAYADACAHTYADAACAAAYGLVAEIRFPEKMATRFGVGHFLKKFGFASVNELIDKYQHKLEGY